MKKIIDNYLENKHDFRKKEIIKIMDFERVELIRIINSLIYGDENYNNLSEKAFSTIVFNLALNFELNYKFDNLADQIKQTYLLNAINELTALQFKAGDKLGKYQIISKILFDAFLKNLFTYKKQTKIFYKMLKNAK